MILIKVRSEGASICSFELIKVRIEGASICSFELIKVRIEGASICSFELDLGHTRLDRSRAAAGNPVGMTCL
jgi:hypothetical protein